MPSRWLRWSRGPREVDTHNEIPTELTNAFLDMERRLDIAQRAAEAAIALRSDISLAAEWVAARDQAYAATAQYVAVSAPGSVHAGKQLTAADAARAIELAREGLDAFLERHRHVLDTAIAATSTARAEAEETLAGVAPVLQRFAALHYDMAGYPSVQAARGLVDGARVSTQSALQGGDTSTISEAAFQLRLATEALDEAVAAAPKRGEQARRTLASVRTRLEAATGRADTLETSFSMLLREFHADSSADLRHNERNAREYMVAAQTCLDQAAAALTARQPEDATTLAGQAREELSNAEALIDAVTGRLAALRAIRADPSELERDIRFRVRDAQRLAVERDAVEGWGSALDAQVPRIDRIVEGLSGRHPDYWKYNLALEEVSEFVTTIVSRIRIQSASR